MSVTANVWAGASAWAVVEVDPELVVAEVGRRFPGVTAYFGEFTGSWWAMVGNRLLEAGTAREFFQVIATASASSRTRPRHWSRSTATGACAAADTVVDLAMFEHRDFQELGYTPRHAAKTHLGRRRQPRAPRRRGVVARFSRGEGPPGEPVPDVANVWPCQKRARQRFGGAGARSRAIRSSGRG